MSYMAAQEGRVIAGGSLVILQTVSRHRMYEKDHCVSHSLQMVLVFFCLFYWSKFVGNGANARKRSGSFRNVNMRGVQWLLL